MRSRGWDYESRRQSADRTGQAFVLPQSDGVRDHLARLDSIAVVVPESVHSHRDAIPQRPKAPAYDLLYFLGYAQQPRSTFSVGTPESIAHYASQLLRWIISFNTSSNTPPALHLISIKTFFLGSRSKPERQKADLARFGRSIPCGEEPAAHTIRYDTVQGYLTVR